MTLTLTPNPALAFDDLSLLDDATSGSAPLRQPASCASLTYRDIAAVLSEYSSAARDHASYLALPSKLKIPGRAPVGPDPVLMALNNP